MTATNELRALRVRETNRYFETGRCLELVKRLTEFEDHALDCLAGGGSRRRSFIVIGESGSGKSTSLERAFTRIKSFQPYQNEYGETVRPLISIEVPKPCSTKDLAIRILQEMGLPASNRANEHELYETVKQQLRERRVLFLHLDEAQDLLRAPTAAAVRSLQDRLKSLIAIPDWPLHTIYSGVPDLARLVSGDLQLANRSLVMRFEPVRFPSDKPLIEKLLCNIAIDHCGLVLADELMTDDFLGRLVASTGGGLGTMIEMVRAACFAALGRNRKNLAARDFAGFYDRASGSLRSDNIITSPRWRDIDRSNALSDLVAQPSKKKK